MNFVFELTEEEILQLAKMLCFASSNQEKMVEELDDYYDSQAAISLSQKSLDAMNSVKSRD